MLQNELAILFADWYKPSHISMYNKKSEIVQDNMTPRNSKYFQHFVDEDNRVMMAGLQGFTKWFLIDMFNYSFFHQPKEKVIAEFKEVCDLAIGPDMVETWGFEALHDLGYLPIEIRALPEGTLSPVQVPLFTIQNTHPNFYWLPNYLESVISSEMWKTITTATVYFQYRKLAELWASETCDNNAHVPFQIHEFAYRGQAGTHDAAQSGLGQLMNSMGTDTIPAILYANRYYNMKGKFVAGSIPASEHSVATTNIAYIVARLRGKYPDLSTDDLRFLAEVEFLKTYITVFFPKGFISYVADSYDFWRIICEAALILKEDIMARDGRVVFRPDSGIPEHIIAGYRILELEHHKGLDDVHEGDFEVIHFKDTNTYQLLNIVYNADGSVQGIGGDGGFIERHEAIGAVQCLWEIFGGEINSKGYKVLDTHVGLIYGDSITVARAKDIFERLKARGFASSNVVLGVGSYTTQYTTRDSLGQAIKATGLVIDGMQVMVSKEPKTDPGKRSATGFLKVVRNEDNVLTLVDNLQLEQVQDNDNELKITFRDGVLFVDEELTTLRGRVADQL